jgi:hypothetical protein
LPFNGEPETAILISGTHLRDAANQLTRIRFQAKCPVPGIFPFHRRDRDVSVVDQRTISGIGPGHRSRKKANYFPVWKQDLGLRCVA